jgi:hypothetical protein
MTVQEWITLAGVVVAVVVSIGPWMLAVQAKLAVLSSQMAALCEKVEKIAAANDRRLEMCMQHHSRLEAHDVQIGEIIERLRDFE